MGVELVEAAEEWLRLRAVSSRASSSAGDRARRGDLAWWARRLSKLEPPTSYAVADVAALSVDMLTVDRVASVLYAEQTREPPAAPKTLARRLSTLRSWCRFLVQTGRLERSPFEVGEVLRIHVPSSGDPKAVADTELERMLEAAASPPSSATSAWPVRDVALIVTLADCGLRAAEAAALRIGDVEFMDPQALRVRRATKGSKARTVPFGADVALALRALFDEYARIGMATDPDALVFRKRGGTRMQGHDLWYLVRRIAKSAGVALPDQAAVHALRHRFGTELSLRGVPLAVLQDLMGHADVSTTAMYTRNNAAQLAGVLDDAGWLSTRRRLPLPPEPR